MQERQDLEEYVIADDPKPEEAEGFREKLAGIISGKYFAPSVIILLVISAFALGRLSGLQEKRPPVRVITENSGSTGLKGVSGGEVKGAATEPVTASGAVVASKSGTKYHYPWCAGAKQISDKNKITFGSIEEARAAGFTPASNCKGLK